MAAAGQAYGLARAALGMIGICSVYATDHSLVFNAKKTVCTIVNKPKCFICGVSMENDEIKFTNHFKYLGVHFTVGSDISVDILPVRRKFIIACNSIIAHSHGVAEPVRVQLIKSFCSPLLVYCIGAVKLKASTVFSLLKRRFQAYFTF